MRRTSSSLGVIALSVSTALTAACGGTAPNTVATSTVPTAHPTATAVENKGPDLSPVTKPATVFVVARMNDLAASVDSVDQLIKLPESLRSLLEAAQKKKKAEVIALHGSFDVALAIDPTSREDKPKFLWAVSVPLKGVDEAVARAQELGDDVHPSTPGAYRVKDKDMTCDITPAVGDAPARAICSEKADSLTELTPWMSRGLAGEPKKPADVWVRADFAPLKERFLPGLKQEAESAVAEARNAMSKVLRVSDPDLLEAPAVISRELFAFADDSDAVELSFSIDAKKPELRLTGGMQFRSKASWLTQVLASTLDRPEGPPEMFSRLPRDATSATWGRTSNPALFGGVRKILHKGFGAVLGMPQADKVLSDADKQAILGWVDGVPSVSGVWVSSSGILPSKKGPEKDLTPQQTVDEAKALLGRYVPWSISGGEGDPTQFITWLKSTEDVLNRGVADVKKVAAKDAKDLTWLPTTRFTKDPAGLPKGSATLDVTVGFTSKQVWDLVPQNKGKSHPKGPEARGTVTIRIAVVPDDAGHFWWGYSTDPEALRSHFAAVVKGAPASGTLASRTDLDVLKTHKGFGGFFSYGSIVDALKNSRDMSESDRKDFEAVMNSLPHKGQGNLFFLGTGSNAAAPTISFDVVASKEMVEDLAGAVQYGYKMVKGGEAREKPEPVKPVPPAQPQPPHRR